MMKKLIVISAMLAAVAAASWGQTGGAEALGDSCVEAHDTFHALQYYGEAMAADSSAACATCLTATRCWPTTTGR